MSFDDRFGSVRMHKRLSIFKPVPKYVCLTPKRSSHSDMFKDQLIQSIPLKTKKSFKLRNLSCF